ncbi:hypothetical protein [Granulicella mallensis]|uniref:Uncharacterized protein n=1 Tax=Granulicella mallensis (strain ATCC BAA-1857 / DSM 23137 / MP5ACTX8) TaxID=682795 RepID=G8NWB0_GRAMM|nr:hypothetical protein [Granulicella mallensis]AEU36622.1 hypothetical protein AciX8_2304 [Granulicella mallensis MP5ACTX8]
MTITPLTDKEQKELSRLQLFYWKEALRCEKAKAYLAGCVMLGSALEALLMNIIDLYAEEAEKTGKIPMSKNKAKPLLKWDLADLLNVAKATGWLPSALDLNSDWNWRKAKVGDYAELVRMMRNLAHPARYLQDHTGRRVTNRYLQRQFEIVLASRDWLVAHNNRELLKAIEEEEKRAAGTP